MLSTFIRFFLYNPLLTVMTGLLLIVFGVIHAPFSWELPGLPSDPVPVDAIPDLGENQQIVYTEWPGRSPQDVEDQISYPLTTALLGVPGVQSVRSTSMFGASSIYLIFEEGIEFYWSRSRVLEKLSALPGGLLPEGVQPALGPDATAVGQVFWYTLEGRDEQGNPAGGWDPRELRSIQDYQVRFALAGTPGVAEVASIGGFVQEYQVDLDPMAMKAYGIGVPEVVEAVRQSNLDVGAGTMEVNRVEYVIRGLGYLESLADLEETMVAERNNTAIRLKEIARVQLGPAQRRGGLDKGGQEAVGAVVVVRHGANPMEVTRALKQNIAALETSLPGKTLPDGRVSKVTIVPFYDRSTLIQETLGTLEEALSLEVIISILVVLVMMMNLRASVVISSSLPLGVLLAFILMRYAGIDANIVALSGIAIAIGEMVDVGIIMTENILRHLEKPGAGEKPIRQVVMEALSEVGSAVLTAVLTTAVSFLPVLALEGVEGRLFSPLAYTKTFSMAGALFIGFALVPTMAAWLLGRGSWSQRRKALSHWLLLGTGLAASLILSPWWLGLLVMLAAVVQLSSGAIDKRRNGLSRWLILALALVGVLFFLTNIWLPLGPAQPLLVNVLLVSILVGSIFLALWAVVHWYPKLLSWCLRHKKQFLMIPVAMVILGAFSWLGAERLLGWATPASAWQADGWLAGLGRTWPGLDSEFMPKLDEGSFLLMPSTMPHAGVEETVETIQQLDRMVQNIPEVETVVGKWGRVQSALDPAPISMFENVVTYKPEYELDESGHRKRFRVDDAGEFVRDERGSLIPDEDGRYFRNWRDHIQSPSDIWSEIRANSSIPGLSPAPQLQPIETRQLMVATGMRASLGIKVFGSDLGSIQEAGLQLEAALQQHPLVRASSVFAEREVSKPYLEIRMDRVALGRYGLSVEEVQRYLEMAVGGEALTSTVEGRARYPVRVRFARTYREHPDKLRSLLVPTPSGAQVPLGELTLIEYTQGPVMIKSEQGFLVSYVIFDKIPEAGETTVVEQVRDSLLAARARGELVLPDGVRYEFAGNYQNQVRANKRLALLIPLCLAFIFLLLYFEFRRISLSFMVFGGVAVALSGGFMVMWLFGQPWFLAGDIFGESFRDLFHIQEIHLSVAVWVGMIALFGIATDDGVIMGSYLQQRFREEQPQTVEAIRQAVIQAGIQRIRPAMMTAATTLIALLPVLSSTGKGADIMAPMSVPIFGGMLFQLITVFVVPVLFCWQQERAAKA